MLVLFHLQILIQFCRRAESLTASVVALFTTHERVPGTHPENSEVATCKGIRIPQYGKFLLVESRIRGKFGSGIRKIAQGIHNPTNDWDPESCTDRGWNPIPGIRNPLRVIQNPRLS